MKFLIFGAMTGLVVGLAGLGVFAGTNLVSPSSVRWVASADLAQQYLGWVAFRDTPWQLPLGAIRGYADPPGTTLGFVDAFPWFSVLMRLLLDWVPGLAGLFQRDGQITGLWLILSLMLQGASGAWIFNHLSPRNWPLIAGGSLTLVLAPVWWHRLYLGHPALCGQWLILVALALALRSRKVDGPVRPGIRGTTRATWRWIVLQAAAAGLHPYIAAMTCAIGIASVHDRARWRHSITAALLQIGAALSVFWLFGYLSANSVGAGRGGGGFHYFGADLLAFVNPLGASAVLPPSMGGWQKAGNYEGFAWLGLGSLLAAGTVFAIRYFSPRKRKIKWAWPVPVMIVLLMMAFFSLGSNVRVGGFWVIDLERPYSLIDPVITTFRSAGRFIWPLYYAILIQVLLLGSAIMQQSKFSRVEQGLVFVLLVSLNVFDNDFFARDWMARHESDPVYKRLNEMSEHDGEFAPVISGASRAEMVPAYLGSFSCRDIEAETFNGEDFADWRAFGMWAARHGLASNSGAFARHDIQKLKLICESQRAGILAGNLDARIVYVFPASTPRDDALFAAIAAKSQCVPASETSATRFCRGR